MLYSERPPVWDHQAHFRTSAQAAAEILFEGLDPALAPQVMLLGLPLDEGMPCCIEPPDFHEQIDDKLFEPLRYCLTEMGGESPHQKDPAWLERQLDGALATLLSGVDIARGTLSRFGRPVKLGSHLVIVILVLDRGTYELHHKDRRRSGLHSDSIVAEQGRRAEVRHLLDAVSHEFLEAVSRALGEPDPGVSPLFSSREHDAVLRAAGDTLLQRLSYDLHQWGYPISLFEACNAIASLRYEGADAQGVMLIAGRGHEGLEVIVELEDPVRLDDQRAARKLLEMSGEQLDLLCDGGHIYGLGRCAEHCPSTGILEVSFLDHLVWEVCRAEYPIMRVHHGLPRLPGKLLDGRRFHETARRIFPQLEESKRERLWQLAMAATEQERGALMIISAEAAREARRLGNQCLRVQPVPLAPESVRPVTAIDGAVLLSPDGVVHAIGVILDGIACDMEKQTRGARYNSALRYVHTAARRFGHSCMGLVVSKDGMIDMLPDVAHMVEQSAVLERLRALQQMADGDTPAARKPFEEIIDWFRRQRQHLPPGTVRQLEELGDRVAARFTAREVRRAAEDRDGQASSPDDDAQPDEDHMESGDASRVTSGF